MKCKALIYFEIVFNSTDLLKKKTLFKNKAVEVNTVKNESRILNAQKYIQGHFLKNT